MYIVSSMKIISCKFVLVTVTAVSDRPLKDIVNFTGR